MYIFDSQDRVCTFACDCACDKRCLHINSTGIRFQVKYIFRLKIIRIMILFTSNYQSCIYCTPVIINLNNY